VNPPSESAPGWAAAASLTYVGAWLAGLFATPAVPSGASAAEVHAHIADHPVGSLIQSLLVHGVAGAALGVLAVTLARLTARRVGGRGLGLLAGTGITAAVLSWVQVALLVVLVAGIDTASPSRTAALRNAIDLVDGAKLVTLAVFVVAATVVGRRTGLGTRWLTVLASVLAPLLVAGAASFLVDLQLLSATLYVSLPLLLLVVGGTGVMAERRGAAADGSRQRTGAWS
jgi:hypothetical protein